MPDKSAIVRLTRVTHVRGLRLHRAAEDARLAHETAATQLDLAQEALARQDALTNEARATFARDPTCAQVRLWLDHSHDLMRKSADAVVKAEADATLAADARADAVRAVARHQVRSDKIAAHHAGIVRAEAQAAEMRQELDATIARVVSI